MRSAHLAWITSQRQTLGAIEQVLSAPADAPWGDAAVAALHTALTTHRGFRPLRNAAPRQPGQRRADAAWDHLARIVALFLHGSIGDHDTADLLAAFAPGPGNLAEQIDVSRAVQEALSGSMLARVAADANAGEIAQAGDQLAFVFVLFLVLVDGGIAMTTSPQDRPKTEVLRIVTERPGISVIELRELLGVSNARVGQLIARLELDHIRREGEPPNPARC